MPAGAIGLELVFSAKEDARAELVARPNPVSTVGGGRAPSFDAVRNTHRMGAVIARGRGEATG